jgi:hypothetical protein
VRDGGQFTSPPTPIIITIMDTATSGSQLVFRSKSLAEQLKGVFGYRERRKVHVNPLPENAFMRIGVIESRTENGAVYLHSGMILFDTGCEPNLMSRQFATALGFDGNKLGTVAAPILEGLGGSLFTSIGHITCRWSVAFPAKRSSRFSVDPKMNESKFEVSTGIERFDILIGRSTIVELGLFSIKPTLGFTGFRQKRPESRNAIVTGVDRDRAGEPSESGT